MEKSSQQGHFDTLLKIYSDFSLREFRFKEGKTAEIREEARRLCAIYKDQCAAYVREHPEVHAYLFGKERNSLGFDEITFFDWQNFSTSLGSALARMQEGLE